MGFKRMHLYPLTLLCRFMTRGHRWNIRWLLTLKRPRKRSQGRIRGKRGESWRGRKDSGSPHPTTEQLTGDWLGALDTVGDEEGRPVPILGLLDTVGLLEGDIEGFLL